MIRLLARALLVLLCLLPHRARATERPVERFAIVIGNNHSDRPKAAHLRYADDDAVATHRLLVDAGVTSVLLVTLDADSRRMYDELRPDGAPRSAALDRAFAELRAKMLAAAKRGSATELLFFYSGHGDIDRGEGYVVLEDGRLTRTKLFELLARSPATRNHVFIDACKSYFLAFDRGPGGRRTAYTGGALTASVPASLANTGFVLSTSSDRDSHEWERYQGGILSHELRSALRGAADADLNGRISYAEIGAFLTVANRAIENPRFRPDFMVRPPANDLTREVLDWRRRSAPLSFPGRHWGHFYVETARGERLLDAHPAPGQALKLWVPDERPLFVRRNDGRAEYVVRSHEPLEIAELTPTEPEIASRGALSLALEELFTVPFGQRDVQAFRSSPPRDARPPIAVPERSPTRERLRTTTGIAALTAAGAGLAFNGAALITYLGTSGHSQRETAHANDRIGSLNRVSLACYAAAAVAGAVFAFATWWPESPVQLAPNIQTAGAENRWTLDVQGRF